MDISLREYLSLADSIHDYVDKFGIALPLNVMEEKIQQLQSSIKNIQAVAKRIADVSNIVNQYIIHRPVGNPTRNINYIDPYPTENDHAVLRTAFPAVPDDPGKSKTIMDNITLPIITVQEAKEIPISNIYYISSLNQYAINIAGVIVKGNLSNIVEYQTDNSARCEYGIRCKSFQKNKKCTYWHDPEDYLKLDMKVPDIDRNFTVGSWLYSKNRRPKTYFTRHIGSKDTLLYDLGMLKKVQYREEISNREGQLIHDLLIYMILHNKGFLERYPHWLKFP